MLRAAALAAVLAAAFPVAAWAAGPPSSAGCDWPIYGHDLRHTLSAPAGCSGLTPSNASTLVPRWFVHTAGAVSASPAVAGGSLYVGAWDGTFYSLDAATGAVRWTFTVTDSHRTAFGKITSSAAVVPFPTSSGGSKLVVLFGGGATLYALDAATGSELAEADLDPRDAATRAAQASNPPVVEIESSPAVALGRIYVGIDTNEQPGVGRTGVIALRLTQSAAGAWSLSPSWKFDAETSQVYTGSAGLTAGSGQGFGCGGVWSSPAVDVRLGLVFFGTSNCDYPEQALAAGTNWAEAMFAIDARDGHQVWKFQPAAEHPTLDQRLAAAHRDYDFGASPNLFTSTCGHQVDGEGHKSGYYYSRDEASGGSFWSAQAAQNGYLGPDGSIGGLIGTPALLLDPLGRASEVVGGSAFPVPDPSDPSSLDRASRQVRALDACTGSVLWQDRLAAPTYAATTIAGGVALVPDTFGFSLQALDARSGLPLWAAPLPGPPSSAAVAVGRALYGGVGTGESSSNPLAPASGIYAFALPGV